MTRRPAIAATVAITCNRLPAGARLLHQRIIQGETRQTNIRSQH